MIQMLPETLLPSIYPLAKLKLFSSQCIINDPVQELDTQDTRSTLNWTRIDSSLISNYIILAPRIYNFYYKLKSNNNSHLHRVNESGCRTGRLENMNYLSPRQPPSQLQPATLQSPIPQWPQKEDLPQSLHRNSPMAPGQLDLLALQHLPSTGAEN